MQSSFAPFRHRAFAVVWTANFVSLVGTWMNEVGAGWLMASLSPSPLWVALVQTAATLPVFLFALPAGALADLVDRRRLIVVGQSLMAAGAAVFALLVMTERVEVWSLLLLTFFLGTGVAFYGPARNAVVPALVPREDLYAAVVLNSMGVNLARAIGPALAGFLIAWVGIGLPFALNALSFLAVVVAFLWWRSPPPSPSTLPREALWGAVVNGLRFARSSQPLRASLVRVAAFFLFASAYWALLPLIAKQVLGGDATLYGVLLGCVGAGAVAGALALPRLGRRLRPNGIVTGASAVAACAMAALAVLPVTPVAVLASLVFGACWVLSLSLANAGAQVVLPDWVRARGMSILLTVFFGSLALGSAVWGRVAAAIGIEAALLASALSGLALLPLVRRFPLAEEAGEDLTPAAMPAPVTEGSVPLAQGPVMVSVEYRVAPETAPKFLRALCELARARRRQGAYHWGVYEDAARPGRFVETYLEASWAAHLRHHARITVADRVLRERVHELLLPDARPPPVTHYVPPRLWWGPGPGAPREAESVD